jgi:23S rRNA pseudouridine955/2504/2580 synthase
MQKDYLALVRGDWQAKDKVIKAPLLKITLKSGERIVRVNPEGKECETRYRIMQRFDGATLVKASPVTGRTHQIRVHCQFAGHAIACDDKYSEQKFDDSMRAIGLNRLFLHAAELKFTHPETDTTMQVSAPLDDVLLKTLEKLNKI